MNGFIWLFLKIGFFFFVFSWVKATVPRFRYDQLMRLGWKIFLPISLIWVFLVSGYLMLDGVVGFYGRLTGGRFGIPPVLDHVGEIRCPVLGLFGGADEGIPTSDVDTFDRLLDEADIEHDIVIYPDAPHSFFDRKYEEHAGACSDAWRRVISFLEKVGAARAA